jgi:hypothetical protein
MPAAKVPPPSLLHPAVLERLSRGGKAHDRICTECAPEVPDGVVGIGEKISLIGAECSRCRQHYCRSCGRRVHPSALTIKCGSCGAKNRFSGHPPVWIDVAPPLPLR